MRAAHYLTPQRSLLLRSRNKSGALKTLVNAVCRQYPALSAADVLAAIESREREISTLISPGIALPHARLANLDEPVIAVGLHPTGLPWQSVPPEHAHLIILVLGREEDPGQHIRLLADIARLLGIESRRLTLLSAPTAKAIYEGFTGSESTAIGDQATGRNRLARRLLSHAVDLARDTEHPCVVVYDDGDLIPEWLEVFPAEMPVILVTRDAGKYAAIESPCRTLLHMPTKGLVPKYRVELAIVLAISQGLIDHRNTVVNVYGGSGLGGLDILSVVDVAQDFENALYLHKAIPEEGIDYQVLSRVLSIALGLANEGREGKSIGTIFVVGDYDRVALCSSQIVINPFKGYPEDERNIIDPSLEETIKEFSAIDGAFLLRDDGVIMAAGACLLTGNEGTRLSSGLGTRHVAAMSVTTQTNALSVVISQSTGSVRIYKKGKEILLLEKTGRHEARPL